MDMDRGFTLGEWTVLPRQSSLVAGDITRHLEPRVMAVLVCLARSAPETVRRNEIFDEVWPNVVVQDEVLSRNVSILRSTLALKDSEHKFIQTVPRVGYRLLDVPGVISNQPDADARVPNNRRSTETTATPHPATDPRGRSWHATLAGITIVTILGAAIFWYLVPGTSRGVAPGQGNPGNAATLSAAMMIAGYSSTERRGADYLNTSIRLFRDALSRDPNAIDAHLGIANGLALLPSYENADSELAFAQALMELALYIKAGGAEGQTHATAAFIELHRMHFIAAEEQFRRAISYNNTDAGVHQWYSQLLARVGRLEKSASEAALAVELDSASPVNQHRLGVSLLWQGDTNAAGKQFDKAAVSGIAPFINPEPRFIQLFRNRQFTELVAMLRLIQNTKGQSDAWVSVLETALSTREPEDTEAALVALEAAWRNKQLDASLYFGVPLFLGDADRAFAAAVTILRGKDAAIVLEGFFLPEAAELRAHPLFASLVQELGLMSYWLRYGPPDVCRQNNMQPPFCEGIMTRTNQLSLGKDRTPPVSTNRLASSADISSGTTLSVANSQLAARYSKTSSIVRASTMLSAQGLAGGRWQIGNQI